MPGPALSEAELLAHYYRVVAHHPAEPTLAVGSVPAGLAEELRALALPAGGVRAGGAGGDGFGVETVKTGKTPRKRGRKSEPIPASTPIPAPDDHTPNGAASTTASGSAQGLHVVGDQAKSAGGSKKRARQSEPPTSSTGATPATPAPAKRKRTTQGGIGGILASYGPCPFAFRYEPKSTGTYIESEYEWVQGRWSDGRNRIRGPAQGKGKGKGKDQGKGRKLEDSSTIPPEDEELEGLMSEMDGVASPVAVRPESGGVAAGTPTTTERTVAENATPANVRVRGRKNHEADEDGGSRQKKKDKTATGQMDGEAGTGGVGPSTGGGNDTSSMTAMTKPDSSYETPTRQNVPLPSSQSDRQQSEQHPPSSFQLDETRDMGIPSSQPTPTRPSKKARTSKKDRLSQLRLDSSQSGPPQSGSTPPTDSNNSTPGAQPATPTQTLEALHEDEGEEEDELEHTPVVLKTRNKEKAKKERKKRDKHDDFDKGTAVDEAAEGDETERSKSKTKSKKRKSGDQHAAAESANTSEESREIVERLLGAEGTSTHTKEGEGDITTPKTKTKKSHGSKKHRDSSGSDLFTTPATRPQADADADADGHGMSQSETKSKSKRHKSHREENGHATPGGENGPVGSEKKEERKKKKKKNGPGWVVNTPDATRN